MVLASEDEPAMYTVNRPWLYGTGQRGRGIFNSQLCTLLIVLGRMVLASEDEVFSTASYAH